MTGKTSPQIFFDVQLNWLADTRAILTAKNEGKIYVATPLQLDKGKLYIWYPEKKFSNEAIQHS